MTHPGGTAPPQPAGGLTCIRVAATLPRNRRTYPKTNDSWTECTSVMHERPEDLEALQSVLDRSIRDAGPHLLSIVTPERRMTAEDLAAELTGMRLLVVATATRDGRPMAGPVDGIFFRGAFHFGSSRDSVRMRHIGERPNVSATHLPSEELAVTVHGRARVLDLRAEENAELRKTLLAVYAPRYGAEWESVLDSAVYARIEADKLFTFRMS